MKAIISSTYDNNYLFFIPITTWLWNKLGAEVICFLPETIYDERDRQKYIWIMLSVCKDMHLSTPMFKCMPHKESTYAQCSRLFASCSVLNQFSNEANELDDNDVIITGDVDMAVFDLPKEIISPDSITIYGSDLVPEGQYPMCYSSGKVSDWRSVIGVSKTYQRRLDDLLGSEECEHFRGNMWARDQETLYNILQGHNHVKLARARPGTQFASHRIDRDDAYFMDRLSPDIIDYHMHRPGYTDENFEKILAVIKYFYPNEDLTWMKEYQTEYKKLL